MLTNVTSLRFALTLLIVVVAFVVSGFVFVAKYSQEVKDFREVSNGRLAGLERASGNLSNVPNYNQTIRKRPKIEQICCEGFEKNLPNTFVVNAVSMFKPKVVSRTNFLFPLFADIDWTFIISLLLSFVTGRDQHFGCLYA